MKYNKLYENWQRHLEEELEEELETVVSEDSGSDTAMVNLLSQISQKLDGLEDIDTSIDYLIGALSGETALSAKMKQSTLGRFADASPQLAELFGKRGLDKFSADTGKEQKERIEGHKKAIADLEAKLQVASQELDPRTSHIDKNDPNAEEYFSAYQKQVKEIPAKIAQLKKELKHLMRK